MVYERLNNTKVKDYLQNFIKQLCLMILGKETGTTLLYAEIKNIIETKTYWAIVGQNTKFQVTTQLADRHAIYMPT